MIKALWFIGLIYLIVVAMISVAAAVITLEPHPKRIYSGAERVWCRRQW